ncbi:hypothetical protein Vadar_024251 [Vaccinium darrowii]|uniref:Uncharacterized protein n=1 Tax=Vaccinium darrowii TaxID=229202 RepID=A0ACB7YYG3_9ERIC|nr:hypothetical protein Vadar_024251 [Vaccinium darrowii]
MDERQNAYFTNLLRDDPILQEQFLMEPQDEIGFAYENEHAQVFTQASQTSARMGSTTKKGQRGPSFTIAEDKLIVSAYLNVSLDAVQGTDQKQKTYWRRVWEFFQENKPKSFVSERNENSLMNRWSVVQLGVNKFCGCVAQVEAKNQSGMNEEDKLDQARDLYSQLHGGLFQFEHCWNKLKFQPKWLLDLERKAPKKNRTSTIPSPSSPELVDLGGADATFVDLDRPEGIKIEKKKRKKSEIPTSPIVPILIGIREDNKKTSDKKMDVIQQIVVQEQERQQFDKERLRQEQEKITIKQDRFHLEQLKEEERIMLVDTSGLPRMQQEYYQSRQMEILQKREKRI